MKKLCMITMLLAASAVAFVPLALAAPPQMPRFRFENFTSANGLPNNHVFAVLVDGDRIWAGTEKGLAVYENHVWNRRRLGWNNGRSKPDLRGAHR